QVVSSSGDEVFFKIKRTTQLRKLLGAYANKVGKDVNTIRFLYDGTRISETDTPHSLEMEDNDTIDVMVERMLLAFSTSISSLIRSLQKQRSEDTPHKRFHPCRTLTPLLCSLCLISYRDFVPRYILCTNLDLCLSSPSRFEDELTRSTPLYL
ncbi:ubiquitin-2 like Rad60 SUMO-like-domain-containing protein, partial [Lentinula raphanica]